MAGLFRYGLKSYRRRQGVRVSAALVAVAFSLSSFAVTVPARAGDPAYGEFLSGQCTTCHQLSGKFDGIPPIVGWDAESFVAVMNAYKTKERENKVMQTIANALGDEEISALAAYFASIKPKD
jgi:cytochrome c553